MKKKNIIIAIIGLVISIFLINKLLILNEYKTERKEGKLWKK